MKNNLKSKPESLKLVCVGEQGGGGGRGRGRVVLGNRQCWGVLLILIIVGQGPTVFCHPM